jgi:predicted MFS family arabinose efflux permease
VTRDARLLFLARAVRMFGYGALGVILVLYLAAAGLSAGEIGLLLTLTLVGDTVISLFLTTHADRIGRRRTLAIGALLMAAAGVVFASSTVFVVLLVTATLGVLSPSGNEVGPFLAVEQASLSEVSDPKRRTNVFASYNLTGSIATAVGALVTGLAVGFLRGGMSMSELAADRVILLFYAGVGIVLIPVFLAVSSAVEVPPVDTSIARRLGLHRSKGIVFRLAALFSLDAFAGGLVIQSLIAFWFYTRFGVPEPVLGAIFFGANILAAFSALAAAGIARRIGLINTMVFTHLPSNVLLVLIPFAPDLASAIGLLLARSALSQMDVPTRSSYVMAVVRPEERPAAASVTAVPKTFAWGAGSIISGYLLTLSTFGWPLVIAGVVKGVYDILLLINFQKVRPPEEVGATAG